MKSSVIQGFLMFMGLHHTDFCGVLKPFLRKSAPEGRISLKGVHPIDNYCGDRSDIIGLGFCVSKDHTRLQLYPGPNTGCLRSTYGKETKTFPGRSTISTG